MNKRKTKTEWKELVTAYKSSGQTAKLWCQANNLSLDALKYWIRMFNKENATQKVFTASKKWVEANPLDVEHIAENKFLEITIGKACIRLTSDFDSQLFSDVVKTLVTLC